MNADFIRGFALAMATINKHHDMPTLLRDTAMMNGLTRRDFFKVEHDPYTTEQLEKIFPRSRR